METPQSIVATLAGLDILVVDDALEMRESYPRWLRAAGASCTVVCTLEDAWRALKRVGRDVLVLDKCLPDGDAHQAFLSGPNVKLPRAIVAVSGYFTSETEVSAQAAGAVVLHKPFTLQGLLHAIELACTRRSRRVRREPSVLPLAAAGPWRVTADGSTLEGTDFTLKLRSREREILLALWQERDAWVSTRALAAKVLGRDDLTSRDTIRSHVRYLRSRLGAHADQIRSDRKLGYRWIDDRSL